MATIVNAYRSVSTPDTVDGVVNITVDSLVAEPVTLVYQNLPKIYADLGIANTTFVLVYVVYQKLSRPNTIQAVYSFTTRFGAKSGNIANAFRGPTGPSGTAGSTGTQGPVGPTGPSGSGASIFDLVAAESINVGDAVSVSAAGQAQKADWNVSGRFLCIGFARAVNGSVVTVQKDGPLNGFTGLIINDAYYLSGTGTITNIPPSNKLVAQPVGVAIASDTLLISTNAFAVYGV